MHRALWLAAGLLGVAVCALYSTHFQNGFHFDDWHAVNENPAIRDLRNAPRFFLDSSTMSVLPANQVYRPMLPLTLAFDYWVGGGLKPWAFHASTFAAFLLLLVVLLLLYRRLANDDWVAFGAASLFGLHPVAAETVNYVVQRSDLWVALLMSLGLFLYLREDKRSRILWPAPVILAWLFKPTAVVFAPLLVACLMLAPRTAGPGGEVPLLSALKRTIPAWALTAAMAALHWRMTPPGYNPGAVAAGPYLWTQPRVALHYVTNFLAPLGLSADTDRRPFAGPWEDGAILGYLFVALLIFAAARTARRDDLRAISLGLWWFLLALLPVALTPLAEVENDHRLFAPMIGLCLSASSVTFWLWRRRRFRAPIAVPAVLGVLLLGALAAGAWRRNQVWRTEETLWADVVKKSPRNGRGWMNFGLTQMAKGDLRGALSSFERAREFNPNYSFLEINTGIALGALGRGPEAENHFRRALILAPADALPSFYYGRWLHSQKRMQEARAQVANAVRLNPGHAEAARFLAQISTEPMTPEDWLNQSLAHHQARRFEASIEAAREALRLRPNYAEAYNNIAAAYEELGSWDEAIAAAEAALKIRPGYELARNNLLYARARKAAAK